jgi:hypothetical protein
MSSTAYLCIFVALALCLVVVLTTVLHCQPTRYNYAIPFDDRRYCFKLRPSVVGVAALGIVFDGFVWCQPHYVVWRLQLCLPDKIAISAIFAFGLLCGDTYKCSFLLMLTSHSNLLTGGLRINSLADIDSQGEVSGIGDSWMWAIARMSTGIIVACCLHLRPLLEKILPCRFIRRGSDRAQFTQTPQTLQTLQISQNSQNSHERTSINGSIMVTTNIAVQDNSHLTPPPAIFSDGQLEAQSPTFDVEQGPAKRLKYVALCCGGSAPSCGTCCHHG